MPPAVLLTGAGAGGDNVFSLDSPAVCTDLWAASDDELDVRTTIGLALRKSRISEEK